MSSNDKNCTAEHCHRWGYQCESAHPGCYESQPWNREEMEQAEKETELRQDRADLIRLQERGYSVGKIPAPRVCNSRDTDPENLRMLEEYEQGEDKARIEKLEVRGYKVIKENR